MAGERKLVSLVTHRLPKSCKYDSILTMVEECMDELEYDDTLTMDQVADIVVQRQSTRKRLSPEESQLDQAEKRMDRLARGVETECLQQDDDWNPEYGSHPDAAGWQGILDKVDMLQQRLEMSCPRPLNHLLLLIPPLRCTSPRIFQRSRHGFVASTSLRLRRFSRRAPIGHDGRQPDARSGVFRAVAAISLGRDDRRVDHGGLAGRGLAGGGFSLLRFIVVFFVYHAHGVIAASVSSSSGHDYLTRVQHIKVL